MLKRNDRIAFSKSYPARKERIISLINYTPFGRLFSRYLGVGTREGLPTNGEALEIRFRDYVRRISTTLGTTLETVIAR